MSFSGMFLTGAGEGESRISLPDKLEEVRIM